MTHFEIARRFTGLSGVELAGKLGVSPQQLQGWVSGTRTPSRTNVETIAAQMDVDAAWLLGVPQRLSVIDPLIGEAYTGGIMRTEEIDGYGMLYHVYLAQTGDIVPVILSAGVQFTPRDWTAQNVRSLDDVAGERWLDHRGADAVMLAGLPRILM